MEINGKWGFKKKKRKNEYFNEVFKWELKINNE